MAASSSSLGIVMRREADTRFCPHRGGHSFLRLHRPPLLPMAPNYNQIVRRASLVSNLNNCRAVENSVSEEKAIGNAKMTSKASSPSPFDDDQKQKQQQQQQQQQQQLDDWMSCSVSEIVRNIGEAPLLMHVYSNSKEDKEEEERVESSSLASTTTPTTPPRIEREIGIVVGTESWSHIRRRWEEGSPIPDGVILVEQLDHHNNNSNNNIPTTEEEEEEEDQQQQVRGEANYSCSNNNNNTNNDNNKTTKTWGVLVQRRGTNSAPACYILKTCRVWSSLGFCTHFCLVRAKCFGEVAELQLNNSWLQQH